MQVHACIQHANVGAFYSGARRFRPTWSKWMITIRWVSEIIVDWHVSLVVWNDFKLLIPTESVTPLPLTSTSLSLSNPNQRLSSAQTRTPHHHHRPPSLLPTTATDHHRFLHLFGLRERLMAYLSHLTTSTCHRRCHHCRRLHHQPPDLTSQPHQSLDLDQTLGIWGKI